MGPNVLGPKMFGPKRDAGNFNTVQGRVLDYIKPRLYSLVYMVIVELRKNDKGTHTQLQGRSEDLFTRDIAFT